jgi:hypothetical protein
MTDLPSVSTCPYIGLKDDPKTSVGYPSTGNFCHHCKAPAVPKLQHQETYCLGNAFLECPVYTQTDKKSFPRGFRAVVKTIPAQNPVFPRNLAILVCALLALFLGWQLWAFFGASINVSLQPTQTMVLATSTSAPTATPEATVTLQALFVFATDLPTETPQPTATPVPPQKHALETPILVNGNQYLIHVVKEGEGIDYLIQFYNTSEAVLRSINYLLPPSIWVDLPVVVSPGMTDVDLNLPTFQAYRVPMAEIHMGQLAKELNANAAMLETYNNCPNSCLLVEGDWLLIPRTR